ncbi:MAG TPA: NAD(P)/FAD-dependent oxidoreductase, partial [Rhizomicrobium sp.]|nr:NAD(P)/FAD-dependent oxidoreductase [Rhizomicrobium sp.]
DMRAAARSIAPYSQADAKAYPEYRQQLFSLARRMRTIWWNDGKLNLRANDSRVVEKLRQWSVFAWLDSWFETNALKAALAFDAMAGSPLEPGSALALLWRASQEMCGLQGAVALPRGGPGALVQTIAAAAQNAGVEIRTGVPVTRIHIQGDIVCGVELARGDMISAPIVISSLPARRTILELADGENLDIAARRRFDRRFDETAAAKVLFAVNGLPPRLATLASGRIVVAEGMEGLVVAHDQARAGDLPDDLAMELIIPTFADPTLAPPGQHIVSVLVRPVPPAAAGWSELKGSLVERTVLAIERVAPGFAKYISAFKLVTPEDMEAVYGAGAYAAVSSDRMLLPWKARVGTGTKGLYLCGASVEPMDAVSGRAGRIAASMILMNRKS